ncbi:hypothetical protein DSO57_1024051 [Entomophthora muscae]|uniref:Uncharacterized protein n=1 Tax=Entomophthora muscae TaxID=34485 RepID=A0ACC2RHG0_9FUNG|nr:hypothetical protein DSO57_1024051 [Entomophthora muscae]
MSLVSKFARSGIKTLGLNLRIPQIQVRDFTSCQASLSKSSNIRFITEDYGVFDDFIPIPKADKPSLFTPEGRKLALRGMRHSAGNLFGIGMIKLSLKGWKPRVFVEEAEELYKRMNTAYASGDIETLQQICLPSFYQKMKGEIKERKGKFLWEHIETIEPSRLITARSGRLADSLTLSQVVVCLNTRQRVTSFDSRGSKIREPITQDVREYYVFQRMISQKKSSWQVYGKISPKPLSMILAKK